MKSPTPFAIASVFKLLLPCLCRLVERLVARHRLIGSYVYRAACDVYVVGCGVVLGDTLLVGNVAGVNDLLSSRASIDVIARVAKAG